MNKKSKTHRNPAKENKSLSRKEQLALRRRLQRDRVTREPIRFETRGGWIRYA